MDFLLRSTCRSVSSRAHSTRHIHQLQHYLSFRVPSSATTRPVVLPCCHAVLDLAKLLPAEHEDVSDEFLRVHSAVRRVRFVAITSSKDMHEYGSSSPPSFFHSSAIARCADYIRNGCSCAIPFVQSNSCKRVDLGELFTAAAASGQPAAASSLLPPSPEPFEGHRPLGTVFTNVFSVYQSIDGEKQICGLTLSASVSFGFGFATQ